MDENEFRLPTSHEIDKILGKKHREGRQNHDNSMV